MIKTAKIGALERYASSAPLEEYQSAILQTQVPDRAIVCHLFPNDLDRRSHGVKQASPHWFLEEIEAPERYSARADVAGDTLSAENFKDTIASKTLLPALVPKFQIDGETSRAVEQPELAYPTSGQMDKCDHRHQVKRIMGAGGCSGSIIIAPSAGS
jgi:hypothetical protein